MAGSACRTSGLVLVAREVEVAVDLMAVTVETSGLDLVGGGPFPDERGGDSEYGRGFSGGDQFVSAVDGEQVIHPLEREKPPASV